MYIYFAPVGGKVIGRIRVYSQQRQGKKDETKVKGTELIFNIIQQIQRNTFLFRVRALEGSSTFSGILLGQMKPK